MFEKKIKLKFFAAGNPGKNSGKINGLRLGMVLFLLIILSTPLMSQASFQGLGFLPGGSFSNARDVSPDGEFVVGGSAGMPYIWSAATGMQPIGTQSGEATGVVSGGNAVCGILGAQAFYWTPSGGVMLIPFLPGGNSSKSWDISDNGQVVVGYGTGTSGQTAEGFIWTVGGGMIGLGDLPGGTAFESQALGVSGDGNVVVGYSRSVTNLIEAFRWTGGNMVGLGTLPGFIVSAAYAASFDGSVIVGYSEGDLNTSEATMWSGGSVISLGKLPGQNISVARDVSGDGQVVVGYGLAPGTIAIIWDEANGIRNLKQVLETEYGLDLTGWNLFYGVGISSDGKVIVGFGRNPSGQTEAWRAVLPTNVVAWSNALGGGFSVGSNWVGGAVPDNNQVALFDTSFYTLLNSTSFAANQPVTITFDDVTTTGGLDINSPVIFDLQAHSYGVDFLAIGAPVITPDEVQLEIINGALGVNTGSNAVLIGAGGTRGQLMVSAGGIFEVDTDDPDGLFVVGANDCGGGECGRLIIQDGGMVFTNASGLGSTVIGTNGGEGSVLLSGLAEWNDDGEVFIGGSDGVGLMDLDLSSFLGDKLLIGMGVGSDGTVKLRNNSAMAVNQLVVGDQGNGNYTQFDGVQVIIFSSFIVASSSRGSVTIEGQSSVLFSFGHTIVGKIDTGHVFVDNGQWNTYNTELGAESGSVGTVFIVGDSAKWVSDSVTVIGLGGFGGVLILGGGAVEENGTLIMGFLNNSESYLEVSSSGSYLSVVKEAALGFLGQSTMLVTDSGFVFFDSGCFLGLDRLGEGEITIEGEGSTIIVDDTLFIAYGGRGGLSVLEGGSVLSIAMVIGADSGSIGSALVDGDSSKLFVASYLRLGQNGVGFVRLTNQGTLEASTLIIGPLGSIDASGGTLIIGGTPPTANAPLSFSKSNLVHQNLINSVSNNSKNITATSGNDTSGTIYVDTLLISEGAQINVASVIFEEGGYLGGEGSFSFDVINSGGMNPGDTLNSPGLFTIDANYTQLTNGTLFIELEGDLPGSGFDQLAITGDAQISGTLDVSALNDFEPTVGQTFEIVTANNISGVFEEIITHRGLGVSVTYNSNNIVITITSPVSVEDENNEITIPTEYSLVQNYPNPFNPTTTIKYSIPKEGIVNLKIYNLIGEEVATLVNEEQTIGNYEIQFNATALPSGVYLYRIEAGGFADTKKMVLLK